jgi:hypothetical protein
LIDKLVHPLAPPRSAAQRSIQDSTTGEIRSLRNIKLGLAANLGSGLGAQVLSMHRRPREKSGVVEGVLADNTMPLSSVAKASVKVPPMSIPTT